MFAFLRLLLPAHAVCGMDAWHVHARTYVCNTRVATGKLLARRRYNSEWAGRQASRARRAQGREGEAEGE